MPDTVEGRRTKTSTKQDVERARAAGVPRSALSAVLGRRYSDVGAQRSAINALIKRYGGAHADQLGGGAAEIPKTRKRVGRKRFKRD